MKGLVAAISASSSDAPKARVKRKPRTAPELPTYVIMFTNRGVKRDFLLKMVVLECPAVEYEKLFATFCISPLPIL
ncbi:hypothetical protein RB195_024858 [Necator americanus]|uniref:Uncharacterized protein n=1 Tax=Necator americanus TaxID=51031 RepID=A0ABR1EPV5_NECAM